VDALIELRERRTVADIFAREGEPHFRAVERQVILSLIPLRHAVIATGGGTFVDPENRAAINADGVSVWLDVPLDVLLMRIPADGRRPLASDRLQMAMLYEARRLAYQQAQIRLDASLARTEELVDQLIELLD
jgi:shikimate kinase